MPIDSKFANMLFYFAEEYIKIELQINRIPSIIFIKADTAILN